MASAAAVSVNVGDYWKYSASASEEGMTITATEKMAVKGTEGSGANEVYVIELSGSGDVSGAIEGNSLSGSVTISGEVRRLTSNFSIVSQDLKESMKVTMMGESAKIALETSQTFSPALDDYIGDNDLGNGGVLVSESDVATTVSMNIEVGGQSVPYSDSATSHAEVTIQIGGANESVTVGAGTFDCYVCTYTVEMDGNSATMTYYYSGTAGNYVKAVGTVEGVSLEVGMLGGSGELKAYSFGGAGTGSSILSGSTMMILGLAIVLVVVVVIVLLVRRRGRKTLTLNVEPPQMDSSYGSSAPPPVSEYPQAPPPSGPGPGT